MFDQTQYAVVYIPECDEIVIAFNKEVENENMPFGLEVPWTINPILAKCKYFGFHQTNFDTFVLENNLIFLGFL